VLDWNNNPLNVSQLMDPYTLQVTFPVLKVINEAGSIKYYQEPFLPKSSLPNSIYNYLWNIPIFYQTNLNSTYQFAYFTGNSDQSWTRPVGAVTWRVENVGFRSFVRVWYDDSTWAPILNQLYVDPSVFEAKTKAMFISDTNALIG
jgi:hypothetical protein